MSLLSRTVLATAALALFVSLCVPSQSIADDLLRVAINTDIRSTNPGVNRDANTDTVIHHIVESLVAYGEDLQVKPMLAKSISVSEDGRIYTFTLKDNVRFHNGATLSSAEVLWNWRRFLDPETRWQCRRWYTDDNDDPSTSVILDVRAPDSSTIVFELEQANVLFLDRLANVQCPSSIVHPDSVNEDGTWNSPIGTGPFELSEWRRGDYVQIKKFDGYHASTGALDGFAGAKPVFADAVRFMISPDHASTKAALKGGGIDIYPGVPMNSLAELTKEQDLVLAETPVLGWTVLLLQTEGAVLNDPRMRRAIAHAIDREQIVGFNTYGHASTNSSAVPAADPLHTTAHDGWYEPSREKAMRILEEIGYSGEIIEIQTNRKYSNMYDNAVVIQAMLHSVGINARLSVLDWATQLANYYAGKFQLSAFSFSALANPTLRYIKLVGPKNLRTTYQWDSPEASVLLAELLQASSLERRLALYERLNDQMRQEIPIIGLYNAHYVTALKNDIVGYRPWPLTTPRYWGVRKTNWRLADE